MGKYNKRHSGRFRYIHAYFGIFRHTQACLETIQAGILILNNTVLQKVLFYETYNFCNILF